jgi:hypothetical protein
MFFSDKILNFYQSLQLNTPLPENVLVMNPYQDAVALDLCSKFYHKFYDDHEERIAILGINPGRFGGGITGIPFTDPVKLEVQCGIANDLKKKVELSADFIYSTIDAYGGPKKFYSKFYFSALSPLGFTKDDKNLNYYDIRLLQETVEPFMISCIEKQLSFGARRDISFCLGEGKNFAYLQSLNARFSFFKKIIPLSHPRFIMQYRRKTVDQYINTFVTHFTAA